MDERLSRQTYKVGVAALHETRGTVRKNTCSAFATRIMMRTTSFVGEECMIKARRLLPQPSIKKSIVDEIERKE